MFEKRILQTFMLVLQVVMNPWFMRILVVLSMLCLSALCFLGAT
jgi:hypothetical protein